MAYREPNISSQARNSIQHFRDSLATGMTVGGSALAIAGVFNPPLAAAGFTIAAAGEVLKSVPVPTTQHAFVR